MIADSVFVFSRSLLRMNMDALKNCEYAYTHQITIDQNSVKYILRGGCYSSSYNSKFQTSSYRPRPLLPHHAH